MLALYVVIFRREEAASTIAESQSRFSPKEIDHKHYFANRISKKTLNRPRHFLPTSILAICLTVDRNNANTKIDALLTSLKQTIPQTILNEHDVRVYVGIDNTRKHFWQRENWWKGVVKKYRRARLFTIDFNFGNMADTVTHAVNDGAEYYITTTSIKLLNFTQPKKVNV